MTTVVDALASTPTRSSVPTLSSVSTSSVCSGRISLQAATSVVLPTPKPPAIRILSASGGLRCSEGAESIDHRLQDVLVGRVQRGVGVEGGHQACLQQITDQYPHHPDRQVE